MGFVTKTAVRLVVIGGLVGGVGFIAAQTPRGRALMHQVHTSITQRIDAAIDDPIAIRGQLRELEAQYPERIAEVRGDLAELQQQTDALEREFRVSERVVELASADLNQLKALISRGREAQAEDGFRVVRVRFERESLDLKSAYARASAINQFRDAHAARIGDIGRDLNLLDLQESRLVELLTQLETEQAEFQTQLWQLDRQVDAIARNDRMIALLEKRQKSIDRYDRYSAESLDQVQGKIAKTLAEQEGRLTALATASTSRSYEEQAKHELDLMIRTSRSFNAPVFEIEPDVFEIGPETESSRIIGRLD